MKQTNKKTMLIVLSIVVTIIFLLGSVGSFSDSIGNDDDANITIDDIVSGNINIDDIAIGGSCGFVSKISVKTKGFNEVELKFDYLFATGGYSVKNLSEDEGEYIGDGMRDYDSSLGKYRILVSFSDVQISNAISERLQKNNTLVCFPAKFKIRTAHPSDHGFVMYICSNTPMCVEEIQNGDLSASGGQVIIPINLNGK